MDNSLNEQNSREDLKAGAEEQTDSSFPVTQMQDILIESVNNDVVETVFDSTMVAINSEEKKKPYTIPSFPEFILPTTNVKNKTLEFLDLWNYDESCTKYQVRYCLYIFSKYSNMLLNSSRCLHLLNEACWRMELSKNELSSLSLAAEILGWYWIIFIV